MKPYNLDSIYIDKIVCSENKDKEKDIEIDSSEIDSVASTKSNCIIS